MNLGMPFIVEDERRHADRDESPRELVLGNLALVPRWHACNSIAPSNAWMVPSGAQGVTTLHDSVGRTSNEPTSPRPRVVALFSGDSSGRYASTAQRVPIDVRPEAQTLLLERRLLDDATSFAKEIGDIVPGTRRVTILVRRDPELGHIVPIFDVLTAARPNRVAIVEDELHERLFRTSIYSRFDEVAIEYSFAQ